MVSLKKQSLRTREDFVAIKQVAQLSLSHGASDVFSTQTVKVNTLYLQNNLIFSKKKGIHICISQKMTL